MRLLLHLRAIGPSEDGPGAGLARFIQLLIARGWRSDLPGGMDTVYSFSNLFPPAEIRTGDVRQLLIASPNPELIRALARQLRHERDPLRVRGMAFRIERHETFSVRVDRPDLRLVTATPVILRVPSPGGAGLVHWTPPLGPEVFIDALNRDLVRRFNTYHGARLDEGTRVIANGTLLRATRSGRTPSSYWEFGTARMAAPARRVLAFAIDAGFGERVRHGFGFVNPAKASTAGKNESGPASAPRSPDTLSNRPPSP
ncbi:MAG: CRISPR-associated endoribonuclease Cas6 [Methanospirillum sp.]